MFRDDSQRLKKLKTKLSDRIARRTSQINQDIFVRDLLVIPKSAFKSHGEANKKHRTYASTDVMERLKDHTQMLAGMANAFHKKNHCETGVAENVTTKQGHENHITRILTPEFYLYTPEPLSTNQFQEYLQQVLEIARMQQENVHLLLSSIPLRMDDNTLLNVCIYVQCGSEPVLEAFSKGRPHKSDIMYDATKKFSQQEPRNPQATHDISAFIAGSKQDPQLVSNNSVFKVKTAGGAEYMQAVDICLDHSFLHSRQLMAQTARADDVGEQSLIPSQVDHILTSNSSRSYSFATITEQEVVHVDPYNMAVPTDSENKVTAAELLSAKKSKYVKTTVEYNAYDERFAIENPPFGHDYFLVAAAERKLGSYTEDLKEIVASHNEIVKQNTIAAGLAQVSGGSQIQEQKKNYDLPKEVSGFFDELTTACSTYFLEWLLDAESFKIKSRLKPVVARIQDKLMQLSNDADKLKTHFPVLLQELESETKRAGKYPENILVIQLVEKIHQVRHTFVDKTPRHHK